PRMAVHSHPCTDIKQLYRQKQRWGVGGLDMVFRGMVIMSIGWIARVALLIGVFAAPPTVVLIAVAAILGCDFVILWNLLGKLQRRDMLRYFHLFALYYIIYVPAIPFVALASKNVVWKERSL